ncbi:Protein GrpE [Trichinella pseudospiralis]
MSGNVESMTSGRVTTNDLQQRITAWSAEYDDVAVLSLLCLKFGRRRGGITVPSTHILHNRKFRFYLIIKKGYGINGRLVEEIIIGGSAIA